MTGFYMRATVAFNMLKQKKETLVVLGLLVKIINETIDISRQKQPPYVFCRKKCS